MINLTTYSQTCQHQICSRGLSSSITGSARVDTLIDVTKSPIREPSSVLPDILIGEEEIPAAVGLNHHSLPLSLSLRLSLSLLLAICSG